MVVLQPDSVAPAPARTRMDTHCHSSASSGPAVPVLKWIGCPESYSEPEAVYDQARARGMDFVTLTDHDTIAGGLKLVERGFQGFILGQEVTVVFPEDGCKLHVLVWGLSPAQAEELDRLDLRRDVYQFARWLRHHTLAHSLAHPIYNQNGKLSRWHLDRCALLFKNFETLNGAHAGTHRAALDRYLDHLTPGVVLKLVEDHGFEPLWPRIWEKGRTGGSDDHALLNVGRTWTSVRADDGETVADPVDFFRQVMHGRCEPGGAAGHGALLAHQLSAVGAHYAARRLVSRLRPRGRYAAAKLLRFAGIDVPEPGVLSLVLDTLRRKLPGGRRPASPLLGALRAALPEVLDRFPDLRSRLNAAGRSDGCAMAEHDRMVEFVEDVYAAAHAALAPHVADAIASRDRSQARDLIAGYLLLELAQVPYVFSLFHQNKERCFVDRLERDVAAHSQGAHRVPERPLRVCLFTDTLGDVNGVSRFIRNAADRARESGRDLQVVTSTRFELPDSPNIHNIAPVLAGKMPKYENLELVLPPLSRMLRWADAQRPDVIHVSTPGPVGLVGVLAARMLRVPLVGTYHTDFPAYVDHLFADRALTSISHHAMRLFYKRFAAIFSRSEDYMASLTGLGIARDRLVRLRPGIDTDTFHPRFADPSVWETHGSSRGTVRVLYCGRVSVEKNLPMLAAAWKAAGPRLAAAGVRAELVVIGDGPYRASMAGELAHAAAPARFLGFRHGVELSTLYASADLFAFPSATDTLGQVVMESQSSGLPALVSDQGGPKEVVREGVTGLVLPAHDAGAWADAIVALARDPERRRSMGRAAHEFMRGFSFAASFDHFWGVHERVAAAHRGETPASAPLASDEPPTTVVNHHRITDLLREPTS